MKYLRQSLKWTRLLRFARNDAGGFSVLEVILAAAIFVIFATGAIIVVAHGYNSNRLGSELSVSSQFASEGIDAARSIKNQAYANLVNSAGTGVIRSGSNVWAFSGANNTLTHNTSDNYTRVLKVEAVNRDVSGNIVTSGGTLDLDTKKITSTVTWNFNSARPETTTLIDYLTDWRKPITAQDNGLLAYPDSVNTPTTPKFRTYTNSSNSFGAETGTIVGALGRNFITQTSPTKKEAIVGYVDNAASGVLRIMCYDGTSWTNDWSVTVGGTGTTRRFDIAYEQTSGDVIVAYSRNVAATNAVDFRTKLGSTGCGSASWSAASSMPTTTSLTTGTVQWVDMASDRRSGQNLITVIWADSASDLGASVWSGSAFGNLKLLETALEVAAAAQDVESFDVDYESSSGDVLVVWGSGGTASANGAWYNVCVGGTSSCTWNASRTAITTMANDATNLDISANPTATSNELVFASIGNAGSDLQVAYWNGSAWTGTNDLDASSGTPVAGQEIVQTGWLTSGATTRSVVVYKDATATTTSISAYSGNAGVFSAITDFAPTPVPGAHIYYDIDLDPVNKDTLLLTFSDANSDLFAKRLVMTSTPAFTWTNADSSAALEVNLTQATTGPFSYAYWRNP